MSDLRWDTNDARPDRGPHRAARRMAIAVLAAAGLFPALANACSSGKPAPVIQSWTPETVHSNGLKITIYTGPTDYGHQLQISSGLGSLWVAMSANNAIMKFSTTGHAAIYATPTTTSNPEAIALGRNKMWFPEFNGACYASIDKMGSIIEYSDAAAGVSNNDSTGAASGKDGTVWFATDLNGIFKIMPNGTYQHFDLPDDSDQPTAITLGPNGNMWFIESAGPFVGEITPKGAATEYAANFSGGNANFGIATGADGRVWFADYESSSAGAVTTAGAFSYYPGLSCQPESAVEGPDGNIYLGETCAKIARVTTSGAVTEYSFPASEGSFPVISLAVGADKNIWFTNNSHSQVGVLHLKAN